MAHTSLLTAYSTTSIRCGTFATMPRTAAVSGRSITWFSRVNPRPLITNFCFSGAQIAERTHFRWIVPLPEFDFFAVICNLSLELFGDLAAEIRYTLFV